MKRDEMIEEIKMGESNFKKQKVAIFKYFPTKPRGDIGNGKEQKYFTENSFDSAIMAKRYLAVPYEPLYRVKIESFIDIGRLKEKIKGRKEKDGRVWASFGLHGGGWEMVTSRIFLSNELQRNSNIRAVKAGHAGVWSLDKELLSGGHTDEYGCPIRTTEHDSIVHLLKGFLRRYEPPEGAEISGWKVPDDFIGGVFYWWLRDFEYTISVLVKSYEGIYNGLKFWGVFWKDDKDKNRRSVYKPIEMIIPGFPLLKENEVKSSPKSFEKILSDGFNDIKEVLRWKTLAVSRDTLSESYDIELL